MRKSIICVSPLTCLLVIFSVILIGCGNQEGNLSPISSTVATPTIVPPSGNYSSSKNATIECGTTGAKIYYTTDGSDPTESSNLYSAPIAVSTSQTIKVRAFCAPKIPSPVASVVYTISTTTTTTTTSTTTTTLPTIATPTINPATGTYLTSQLVTLECGTSGAEIRYTTDGSDPSATSTLYSAPFSVFTSQTIKAKAFKSGWSSSSIASATYTMLIVADPIILPVTGAYLTNQLVTIECGTSGAEIRYTTDGSAPSSASSLYSAPFFVAISQTIKARAFKSGWTTSSIISAAYTLTVATPVISPTAGTYSGNQLVTLECSTLGAEIRYTTDGSDPTAASTLYSAPFSVSTGQTVKIKAFKSGWTESSIASATYAIPVATPTISPVTGTYSNNQLVTLECSTSGAEIRYTTDGLDPSATSTLYSAPFSVFTSQTIKAKAFKSGWTSSGVVSATYTIAVATPTISPATGTYLISLVTLECSTSGAEIRYTTDGSDPIAASTLYSAPFTVSTSQTVKAKAFKVGCTSSSIASAIYTISLQISVIDATPYVGKHSSIAVDSANNPHIVYFDLNNKSIKYTYWNGISWQAPATIDPAVGDDGAYCSIAIDNSNKTHVSYFDDVNGDLKYATNTTGAWVITSVDTGGIVGKYPSIAIDKYGKIHISYYDVSNYAVKYATNVSGVWVTTKVADAGTNYGHSSIAVDSRRKIQVSFYNSNTDHLSYVTNMSSSWQTKEAVDSSPSDIGSEAGYNSIALDIIDDPYIAYNGSLKYSHNSGVAWASETIDNAATSPAAMKYISMAKENSNDLPIKLHISYFDGVNSDLKYATNSSGSWQVYTLDSTGVVGRYSSIAIDSNKKFHISYYDDTNHQLKYATNK